MTTTPETLQMLPIGTGYHKKDGQANLAITKDDLGNIHVEASCDSLERALTMYEEETTRLYRLLEEKETEPPPCEPTGWQWLWIRFGQLTLILAVARFGLRKLKDYINSKT